MRRDHEFQGKKVDSEKSIIERLSELRSSRFGRWMV